MTRITVAAQRIRTGVKLNLYLEVMARRADGYHELRTLFYPLPEPGDLLDIGPAPAGAGLVFSCDQPGLAGPGNIVVKAYEAYCAEAGARPDMAVRLAKGAPTGAGLGGGSADGAAMLRVLRGLPGMPALPRDRVLAIAAGLGADVPFFLMDGPAWATGIGERLEPAAVDLAGMSLVLVCPDVAVSTAWAYARWDALFAAKSSGAPCPAGDSRLTDTPTAPSKSVCRSGLRLYNSFEEVVFPEYEALRVLKETCLRLGAAGALMSGSGASIFALFRTTKAAHTAADALRKQYAAVFVHHS
ncbi:MAG: 4-(cytidine 5'-diphospho)-2-C-methyl-D-erythritol kinase [Desulfovibrionaceae bacterium]